MVHQLTQTGVDLSGHVQRRGGEGFGEESQDLVLGGSHTATGNDSVEERVAGGSLVETDTKVA